MSSLRDKKLDAIMRYLVAQDSTDKEEFEQARETLVELLQPEAEQPEECLEDPGLDAAVEQILLQLGVPNALKGYRYLAAAVKIAVEDPGALAGITTGLYPQLARQYNTISGRVERSMRHAIESGWDRCPLDVLMKYFGNTVSPLKARPTNREYIARVAAIVRAQEGGRI